MRRRLSAGLLAVLLTAGCVGQQPVSPLPIEAGPAPTGPAPTTSASPPSVTPSAVPRPTRTVSPRPTRSRKSSLPSSCQGAVVVTIDTQSEELALVPSLCVAVGAELIVRGVGPGDVDVTPDKPVDGHYEGGVIQLRFLRRGTIIVTIPQNGKKYRIPVVVR